LARQDLALDGRRVIAAESLDGRLSGKRMRPLVIYIAAWEEEMHELSRNKRAVDMKFRKVRLAFEGPKKAAPRKITLLRR
jgi:hypothetical protein